MGRRVWGFGDRSGLGASCTEVVFRTVGILEWLSLGASAEMGDYGLSSRSPHHQEVREKSSRDVPVEEAGKQERDRVPSENPVGRSISEWDGE